MIFKNLGSLLMKLALLITCILLTCVSLCHKGLKKHLVMKINITKFLWIQLQKTITNTEEEVLYSSWVHRCTYSAGHSSKRFKSFPDIMLLCQGCCWVGKNTNKEFSCCCFFFLLIIIRPSSTFNFWSVFGFNEYLSGILSLMNVESFWFHVWVVVARLLILQHKWPQVTFWPMSKNKKLEFKDHQIHFKMLRKILKKEV